MKKFFKILFYTLAVLIILLIVSFSAYVVWVKTTSVSAEKFINQKFSVYAHINDPVYSFDRLNKSQIIEVLRSEKKFLFAYKYFEKIRSLLYSRSWFLREIASVNTHAVYYTDNTFTITFDLGLRTLFARIGFSAFKTFIADENKFKFKSENYKEMTINYFKELSSGMEFYFVHYKNLFIISMSSSRIKSAIDTYRENKGIQNHKSFKIVKENTASDAIFRIYGNTRIFTTNMLDKASKIARIAGLLAPRMMSFSFKEATRKSLEVQAYQHIETKNKYLKEFFSSTPRKTKAGVVLPAHTAGYVSFTFKNFKTVWNFLQVMFGDTPSIKGYFKLAREKIKDFTKMSLEQWLFSWVGNEIGLGMLADQKDPFIVIHCRDKHKAIKHFEILNKGTINVRPHKFQYKGHRVNQIALPPGMYGLAKLFVPSLPDLPYYMTIENVLIITTSRRVISEIIDAYKTEKVLNYDKSFKNLIRKVDYEGNVFAYWDTTKRNFGLLKKKNMISQIIRQYNKGIITVNFFDNVLSQKIYVEGKDTRVVQRVLPFPKSTRSRIISGVRFYDIDDDGISEIIYAVESGRIYVLSSTGVPKYNWAGKRTKAKLYSKPKIFKYRGDIYIAAVDSKGSIYVWNKKGDPVLEFKDKKVKGLVKAPIETGDLNGDSIPDIVIATVQGDVYAIDMNANFLDNFPVKLDKGIYIKPLIMDFTGDGKKEIIVSVRSFKGDMLVISNQGKVLEDYKFNAGWFVEVPLLVADINNDDAVEIIAINKKGKITVFNKNGVLKDFTVDLSAPVKNPGIIFKSGGSIFIGVLLTDGRIAIISSKGEVSKILESSGPPSSTTALSLYKLRGHYIFVYAGNDKRVRFTPGKKIKFQLPTMYGSENVEIKDMDNDGYKELLTSGYDRKVYLYRIFK